MVPGSALVFANPDGTPYNPDAVGRRFGRRGPAAGLPRLRFHDLRHTSATLLLESGVDVKTVAERLGDRVETVLETYAHVTSKARTQAASWLAAVLEVPHGAGLSDQM